MDYLIDLSKLVRIKKYKEEYPLLYGEAVRCFLEFGFLNCINKDPDECTVNDFDWFKSGNIRFWELIYYNRLDRARELQPFLFEQNIEGAIIKNGLFKIKKS